MNHGAALAEPMDVVAKCDAYLARHPERVDRAVTRWVEKAAEFGVKPPAFVPLRPFLLPESLLHAVGDGLNDLIGRVTAAVREDPAAAGIAPAHATEVGLLDDLDEPRLRAWARPDGFLDGDVYQVTELNIGNGAAVTSIETAWLTELYDEMGLFDAVPELVPRDPLVAWRRSLDEKSDGGRKRALGVVVRQDALQAEAWRMFEGQLAAFLDRFLDEVELGGLIDPSDTEAIAEIDARGGAFLQFGTEAMVAMRRGYQALRDPDRRARWWLPPTVSLLDKNILPLASAQVTSPNVVVPEAFWVKAAFERALLERESLIFKSSINEKGVLFGDALELDELTDRLRMWDLREPLIAQRRARLPKATLPVKALDAGGAVGPLSLWVETSPFLIDGKVTGVFCRCLPASDPRPVMSPPPDGLGLGIAVGVRGR